MNVNSMMMKKYPLQGQCFQYAFYKNKTFYLKNYTTNVANFTECIKRVWFLFYWNIIKLDKNMSLGRHFN